MNYTVGFARLDITPPMGVPLGGSWQARTARGVHDPLMINAVAFGDGEKSAVLLVADLLGVYGFRGYQWAADLEQALELPKHSIILCCTHTHTGPSLGADEQYDQWLFRRLKDAAAIALADRKPVTGIYQKEDRAEGMAFVRRWILSDGTVMTNPAGEYQKMIVAPAGYCDDTMRVIRITREEGKDVIIANFQAHPDNIGGEFVSADYPGAFRNQVEAELPNTHCVFLDGCEGQMVIADRRLPREKASIEKATKYGIKLAGFCLDFLKTATAVEGEGLSFGQLAIDLKTKRDPSRVPEAERIIELHAQGRDLEFAPTQKQANYMLAESKKIVGLEKTKEDYRSTAVSAIAFCGLAFVGIPGEPFNEVGVQIRKNAKFPVTCVMCQANGCHGYYPTAEGYDQGGYESYNTPYVKGTAEQLADTADKLLASL